MPAHRFNWDNWDTVVTECDGTKAGDVYRTDNNYACATEVPTGAAPSGCPMTPTPSAGLTGCQLLMPPRIDEINIIPSSHIEIFIYGEGIH
jgi:hypothetical protein